MPSKKVTVVCEYCNRPFQKALSEVRRLGGASLCSKTCAGKHRSRKTINNFYRRISIDSKTGCWNWEGATNKHGYGVCRLNGDHVIASRASWEINFGKPPVHVLHKCDNQLCVNPSHLFSGTHKDNMDDMTAKGRRHSKLSDVQVLAILSSEKTSTELADSFGVSPRTIRRAREPQAWPHLKQSLPEAPK